MCALKWRVRWTKTPVGMCRTVADKVTVANE